MTPRHEFIHHLHQHHHPTGIFPQTMSPGLLKLPYELLLQITEHDGFRIRDLSSLLRCNRVLADLLTPSLHKIAATQVLDDGRTVLLWSSEKGYARQVALLVEQGSDIEAKDFSYKTPLIKATENGHLEVTRVLLEKGANTAANAGRYIDDGTALHVAAGAGQTEIIKLLLEYGANIEAKASRGARPLHWAVEGENEGAVGILLEKNADINAMRDYDQETPLKLTPENEGDGIFELLVENGADIDIRGRLGETVLLQAVAKERVVMVKKLLEKGANIFVQNEYNDTALHLAVTYAGDNEIARLLLDKISEELHEPAHPSAFEQAYLNIQNDEGDTPLHRATRDEGRKKRVEVGKVIRQLAEENCDEIGIDPNEIQTSAERSLTAFVMLLLERGADPNYTNRLGRTPLHNAAANGYPEMARLLLNHGAMVDLQDVDGYTPLSRAARVSWTYRRKPEQVASHIEVVRLLLEWGADPCHKDKGGGTIGEWAEGNQPLADLLGEGYDQPDEFMDRDYYDQGDEKALNFGIRHYPTAGGDWGME